MRVSAVLERSPFALFKSPRAARGDSALSSYGFTLVQEYIRVVVFQTLQYSVNKVRCAVRRALRLLRTARSLASTTPPSRRTYGRGFLRCVPPRAAGAPVASWQVAGVSQSGSMHVYVHEHVHVRRACASTASRCRASATPRSFSCASSRTCSASGGARGCSL